MSEIQAKFIMDRARSGKPFFGCRLGERTIYFHPLSKTYEEDATFVRELTLSAEVFSLSTDELSAVKKVFDQNKEFVENFFDSLVYKSVNPEIKFLPRLVKMGLLAHERVIVEECLGQITFIYLIKDNRTGFVKIGRSRDPQARLRQLIKQDTLLPEPNDFSFICYWQGYENTEAFLHTLYGEKRVRGEWFALTETDIEEIKKFQRD